MARIGFIGLGAMGGPMARNLVKAGHVVRAYDISAPARQSAGRDGCTPAASIVETVADAEVVLTMLPAGGDVRAVYEGAGGVFAHTPAGALCIDRSTIDVDTARGLCDQAAQAGFAMVDAPVSGGMAGAQAATLTFMVGGDAAAVARAEPILKAMGKAVVHAGAAGTGQAAKLCNNMLLGISMIGTCEAFNLAKKLGLDAQVFFDITSKSSGQCWSVTTNCPVPGPVSSSPANRGYVPGFATALMLKDLKLAEAAAMDAGASIPLGAEARALFERFNAAGGGAKDFSAIIEMIAGP
jgi:3-hydroxyisobutyrate dehydrogenase